MKKSVHFVGSFYIDISQCTVQETYKKFILLYVSFLTVNTNYRWDEVGISYHPHSVLSTTLPVYLRVVTSTESEELYSLSNTKPRSRGWYIWRTFVTCGYLPHRGNGALAQVLVTCPFPANKLTPWSRVLLRKLTCSQPVEKFPAFHGTRMFITAFTWAHHLSLSWGR